MNTYVCGQFVGLVTLVGKIGSDLCILGGVPRNLTVLTN